MKKTDTAEAFEERAEEIPVRRKQPVQAVPPEPEYSVDELIESHREMGYAKEYVAAALRHGKVTRTTFQSAKVIVERFMRRVIG